MAEVGIPPDLQGHANGGRPPSLIWHAASNAAAVIMSLSLGLALGSRLPPASTGEALNGLCRAFRRSRPVATSGPAVAAITSLLPVSALQGVTTQRHRVHRLESRRQVRQRGRAFRGRGRCWRSGLFIGPSLREKGCRRDLQVGGSRLDQYRYKRSPPSSCPLDDRHS
jgi:hypothetical protein